MISLDKDLQVKRENIEEFGDLAIRILNYLPNVQSSFETKSYYRIYISKIAGTSKYLRPINEKLFIFKPKEFEKGFAQFLKIIERLKDRETNYSEAERATIDSVVYTIQQSIGAGLDLLVDQNSARKHVGNRFEELVRAIFTKMQVANKRTILKIPYDTDEGEKIYKCENDLILSPYDKVRSTSNSLDEKEIVVSVKTTSKDRMGKMFIDKLLLERFVKHKQSVIGIFLNDVQRKEDNNMSFTLVSGLFMVYTKFLTELQGIYYLDPPPTAMKNPFNKYMKPFSILLTKDIFKLLAS